MRTPLCLRSEFGSWMLAIGLSIICFAPGVARPATFTVTSTADNANSASDPTTLRGAIAASEASTDQSDTIAITATGLITLSQGELDVYNGQNVSNKKLTIEGSGTNAGISGGGQSRVFHIESNGTGDIQVTLFKVGIADGNVIATSSSSIGGGGIAVTGEQLTLQNCLVDKNIADSASSSTYGAGGGIYIDESSTFFANLTTVTGNIADCTGSGGTSAAGAEGGGIYCEGTMQMTLCTVGGNIANGHAHAGIGGGIYNSGFAEALLTECKISNNETLSTSTTSNNGEGGGLAGGSFDVIRSAIFGNSCTGSGTSMGGGGVAVASQSELFLSDCVIAGNSVTTPSGNGGGGVEFQGDACNLTNCTIANNKAPDGGACSLASDGVTVTNCTISGNSAGNQGGGIYLQHETSVTGTCTVLSSIVAGNTASESATNGPDLYQGGGTMTFASGGSNLIGVGDDTGIAASPFTNGASHNQVGTSASPLNPMLGQLEVNGGSVGTMALLAGSPAIDADFNVAVSIDQRQVQRPRGVRNDIGAYEYGAPIGVDDEYQTPVNTPLVVSAPGVLANDLTEGGSTALNASIFAEPYNGTLTITGSRGVFNGSFTYTPSPGFIGTDVFIYQVLDADGLGTLASVQMDVGTNGNPLLHTFQSGLQMFAVTEDYSGVSLSTALTGFSETLAVWEPASNEYALTPNPPANDLVPGQGYWVRFTSARDLTDTGVPVSSPTLTIPLAAGWNMIGDPFPVALPLSSITVAATGSDTQVPMANANQANLLYLPLYAFQPGDTNYEVLNLGGDVQPYLGYWIHAIQPCTLTITNPD